MIKKYKLFFVFILFINSKTHALSPEYEKQLYVGCYTNSKTYIGPDEAKNYCACTVQKLSNKFSDVEINLIFKQKPEEIMRATEFATIECTNNK